MIWDTPHKGEPTPYTGAILNINNTKRPNYTDSHPPFALIKFQKADSRLFHGRKQEAFFLKKLITTKEMAQG